MPLMGVAVTEDLIPHPNNYVEHPQDQIDHLKTSLVNHGFYRNIVVANENYIIAGHGVWMAAKELGMEHVPIVKMDIDPFSPEAMKLLIGDNEVRHLVVTDDRGLADMMIDLTEDGGDLRGTGWDQMMLANFVLITRDKDEIQDLEHSRHWIGLPGYERVFRPLSMTIHTRNAEDRAKVLELLGLQGAKITKRMVLWWPPLASQQPMDLKFMPESLVQQSNGDAAVAQDPASPATEVSTDDAPVIAAENVPQVADPGELDDMTDGLREALAIQAGEPDHGDEEFEYENPDDGEVGEPVILPDEVLTPEDATTDEDESVIVPESTATDKWQWNPWVDEEKKEESEKPPLFGAVPADRYTS